MPVSGNGHSTSRGKMSVKDDDGEALGVENMNTHSTEITHTPTHTNIHTTHKTRKKTTKNWCCFESNDNGCKCAERFARLRRPLAGGAVLHTAEHADTRPNEQRERRGRTKRAERRQPRGWPGLSVAARGLRTGRLRGLWDSTGGNECSRLMQQCKACPPSWNPWK